MTAVLFVCCPWARGQVFSSETRLSNCTGSKTIVRQNQIGQRVICYHDSHDCSTFVVEGTSKKKFATSVYQSPSAPTPTPISNHGYLVRDMEILDGICWFCGEKWESTGEYLYTPGGLAYPEVTHDGFVGRFNINDVLSGNGNCQIMLIPSTSVLTNLAVYTGGVTAIAEKEYSPYPTNVVELQETASPGAYLVRKCSSQFSKEIFMDVAWAGGKVVTLSRYTPESAWDSTYHKYCFGLRYGTPSNYVGSASVLYNYWTNKVFFPADIGRFSGITPIFLTHTNNGNGVVVSYLGNKPGFFQGRLLMTHIPSIGASTVETRINFDSDNVPKYSEIKEVHFNLPSHPYSKMAVLVKDIIGNSTFRFPWWDTYNHDTIQYSNSFDIESFVYYYSGMNSFSLLGVGQNSANKITKLWQHANSDWPTWNTMNCANTSTGFFHGDPGYDCVDVLNTGLNVESIDVFSFSAISVTLTTPFYFQTCSDGTSNSLEPTN